MSRPNKVNKDFYTQAGRLTPDEAARERKKQREESPGPPSPASTGPAKTGRKRKRGLPK
jgi:hypothetical protein